MYTYVSNVRNIIEMIPLKILKMYFKLQEYNLRRWKYRNLFTEYNFLVAISPWDSILADSVLGRNGKTVRKSTM